MRTLKITCDVHGCESEVAAGGLVLTVEAGELRAAMPERIDLCPAHSTAFLSLLRGPEAKAIKQG